MSRKTIGVVWLVALALAPFRLAEAQKASNVPRIGVLCEGSVSTFGHLVEAFRQGLYALGYVEGKNISIEYRWAEGKYDQLPALADELVSLKIDVIVAAGGAQPALAAKKVTTTIPIVFTTVDDPVAFGIVPSLARPGGNITGLSNLSLHGKRLELVKESFPKISRVAVLWNPDNPGSVVNKRAYEGPAQSLGIRLQSVELRDPNGLDEAFSTMKRERAGLLVTVNSPLVANQLKRIVDLAVKSRLPTMSSESRWTEAGGVMSYGPSYPDQYRHAAIYVDKILKGAKPAELPVEQPTKFEFIINLRTAKQIGVTFPQSVLYQADRVIK